MGTSNFTKYSARKIYAVIEEDAGYDTIHGDYLWDDTKINVAAALEKIAKQRRRDWVDDDRLRRLESSIGYYRDIVYFYDVGWDIKLTILMIPGYYRDFSLDYDIEIGKVEYNDYVMLSDDIEDYTNDIEKIIKDIIEYDSDSLPHKGLFIAQRDKIKNKLVNFINTLQDEVESVLEQYSTPLEVFTRFSNGETIYTRA